MLWLGYYPVNSSSDDDDGDDGDDTPITYTTSFTIKGEYTPSTVPLEGATVTVDDLTGGPTGSAGGCTVNDVPEGTHTLTVTCEGYETYTDTITVDESHTTFNITLTASELEIQLNVVADMNDPDPPSVIDDAVITDMNSETVNIPFETDGLLTLNLKPGVYYLIVQSGTYGVPTENILEVDKDNTIFTVSIDMQ